MKEPSALNAEILEVLLQMARKFPWLSKASPAAWMNCDSPSPWNILSVFRIWITLLTHMTTNLFSHFSINITIPDALIDFIHIRKQNCVSESSRESDCVFFTLIRKINTMTVFALKIVINKQQNWLYLNKNNNLLDWVLYPSVRRHILYLWSRRWEQLYLCQHVQGLDRFNKC